MSLISEKHTIATDELEQLRNIQQSTQQLIYELGEIELLKIQLEERHTTAKQTLSSLTQQETQFNQSLFDKYGNIQLNPQTGEYTQTK
jgi:hypothetical protein